MRRASCVIAVAALACWIGLPRAGAQPASAPPHPLVGIADENLQMFHDPRFLALGIKQVRLYVSWDVLSKAYRESYRRDRLAAWLAGARADGLDPLITFDRSDRRGHGGQLPSVQQYSTAFLAFRRLYPWVREFATWNEANYYGEPTAAHPRRIAGYYLALRRDCPSCTILAAELLDIASPRQAVPMVEWAREFVHYAHTEPAYWGLHNYVGANSLSDSSLVQLMRAVGGDIWLTETGGIVALPHHGKVGFPLSAAHEARVDKFLLTTVARLSPRIQRIYFYEWRALREHAGWDSAMIAYDDKPRQAYDVLAETLRSWGVAPGCELASESGACGPSVGQGGTGPSGPVGGGDGASGPTGES